jgi:hypothetical protein
MKLISTIAVLAVTSGALLERDDRQLRQILSRAPHLANSGTELHELMDWLNHRCEGCLGTAAKSAKAALTKEIRGVQEEQEAMWASKFEDDEKHLTAEALVFTEQREQRARKRAEEELQRKEDLRRRAEAEAKAQWQREQELLWQQQEQQKAEKLETEERRAQEKREMELAQLRKYKLAEKLSLYDKEALQQWVEIEEKEQARKAQKEHEIALQAETELAAVRKQKLMQKRQRLALAEKAAALEAERQAFLGKFWPLLRPILATFFREIRAESLDDALTSSPLIRTDMIIESADGR